MAKDLRSSNVIDLEARAAAAGTEVIPCELNGRDVYLTAQQIADLGGGGGSVTSVDGQTGAVDLSGNYDPLGAAATAQSNAIAASQPVDADLTAIALLSTQTFGRARLTDTNAAAAISALGLDADIATLALPASTTISAFGATLVDDADGAAVRTTIGAAPSNPLATDTLWDAAGDTVIGTGADTATKLTVSTFAGAALVADPNATNKVSWNYPHTVEAAARGITGALASTYDRSASTETNSGSLLSARITAFRIFLPKGLSIANISFWSMTTALSVGVNQWFGLADNARLVLAKTADDTSAAWAANTAKTLAVTGGPYVTTRAGWYYVFIMVKATTVPTLVTNGSTGTSNIHAAAPIPVGSADTGLTDPASCPSSLTALTAQGGVAYAEVS